MHCSGAALVPLQWLSRKKCCNYHANKWVFHLKVLKLKVLKLKVLKAKGIDVLKVLNAKGIDVLKVLNAKGIEC